jgi:hypothetical protein
LREAQKAPWGRQKNFTAEREGLQRKYSPPGFVPIGMDCMALTCLRQVSANGIPQDLHGQIRGIAAESPVFDACTQASKTRSNSSL